MSTQTVLGHSFPTPCKRCGGALYRQVDYCPYCGAVHPLDAGPHKRTVIPGSRASAMNPAAQKNAIEPPARSEAELGPRAAANDQPVPPEAPVQQAPAMLVSPDTPIPPLSELPYPMGPSRVPIRKVLLAIGAIVVIGLAYVVYALFGGDHDSQSGSADQSAETAQDARTTTGTIAPYAPAPATRQSSAATTANLATPVAPAPVVPVVPVNPANVSDSAKSVQVIPATPIVPLVAAPSPKPAAPQYRDAGQALQSARLAFRANDLSAAQNALDAAQALQPANADAQDLANQLKPLSARRDAALQAAQTCVAQQAWPCARQHANDALAIDAGNETARTILERVIRETGWAPLNQHTATAATPAK
ncbi:hypothetical protein [Paraburkholderia sp. BCC1884]|uniref:hypothetical protein n=1 Tax=Paraburkholderia sp. BCC1884 TaxID=2562668 RepID=UPI001183021D|nr:hypothetical protein [Paraburkholderia sp. BCC1884]